MSMKKITTRMIAKNFKIDKFSMSDSQTGEVMFEDASGEWGNGCHLFIRVPKRILMSEKVLRSLTFSSVHPFKDLRVHQTVYLKGNPIEVWDFEIGYVMAYSQNTWATEVQASGIYSAEELSGNVLVDTRFLAGDKCFLRIRFTVSYV